jgi:hypothetical protein
LAIEALLFDILDGFIMLFALVDELPHAPL